MAVVQIIILALLGVIGMAIQQLPDAAFRSVGDYAAAMEDIHARYDPVFGPAAVSVMERLSVFSVFRSVWFSTSLLLLTLSIIICTLDRTPRLWRGVAEIRVAQPDAYFDPRLPDRAAMTGLAAADVSATFRRRGFKVREEPAEDGAATYVYGDRNQYTKMATLFTHLGLILFLVAAVVTSVAGDEQGLVVAEGESLTVQPIGTPGCCWSRTWRSRRRASRRAARPTSRRTWPSSRTARRSPARRSGSTTRWPSAATRSTRTGSGRAQAGRPGRRGPAAVGRPRSRSTDSAAGRPYGILAVPGRDIGLQLLLEQAEDGTGVLIVLPYRVVGTDADGSRSPRTTRRSALQRRRHTGSSDELDLSIELTDFSEYTLLIAKADPGQGSCGWPRSPMHRDRDHVLPAAPARLGAGPDDRRDRRRLAVGSIRRCRARIRSTARRSGGRPPTDLGRCNHAARLRAACRC